MKYRTAFLLIFILFLGMSITAQNLTFEEYNPTSTLVVPENKVIRAKFPFIDVHGHQYRMPTQDLSPVVAAMDTLNMKIMVLI